MIRIKIEKIVRVERTEEKNFLIKSTPTEITKKIPPSSYSSDREPTIEVQEIKEYQVSKVQVSEEKTFELLRQEIQDDDKFNLAAVIVAINGLGQPVGPLRARVFPEPPMMPDPFESKK